MSKTKRSSKLFHKYYREWVDLYKSGAVRPITLQKYNVAHLHLVNLVPDLTLKNLDRTAYQKLINNYALTHEKQTTIDFHHQIKGAILDAIDEGLIERDPTRKVVLKGKEAAEKKIKYLNQFELRSLLQSLNLEKNLNWDWFILLVAKTGLRFGEALALTPADFDFQNQQLIINKTWNYKEKDGGFQPTKNLSSIRKVPLDWQTSSQFAQLITEIPLDKPIFINQRVYNATINERLGRHCLRAKIPVISLHGLRHTHASLLLFAGVSIASVARRLGHSSITTTQETYIHIVRELENQDNDKVIRFLATL